MPDLSDAVGPWLVAGGADAAGDTPHAAGIAPGAAGLLRRLFESFTGDPVGPSQQIDAAAGVVMLAIPSQAIAATVSVTGADVRVTFDGSEPTTTRGVLLAAGTVAGITGRGSMQAAKLIGAAGAVLDVTYWD